MALKLVTPPASEPVGLDDAKLHLRVTDKADDSYVSALIMAAREWCEAYLRRALVTQAWRQTLASFPSSGVIALSRPPLVSVEAFTYVDTDGVTQTLSDSLYTVDTDSEPGRVVLNYGESWPAVRSSGVAAPVTIAFTAGYGPAESVPEVVKAAMKLLIGHWYEHREEVSAGLMAKVPTAAESLLAKASWGAYP